MKDLPLRDISRQCTDVDWKKVRIMSQNCAVFPEPLRNVCRSGGLTHQIHTKFHCLTEKYVLWDIFKNWMPKPKGCGPTAVDLYPPLVWAFQINLVSICKNGVKTKDSCWSSEVWHNDRWGYGDKEKCSLKVGVGCHRNKTEDYQITPLSPLFAAWGHGNRHNSTKMVSNYMYSRS